MALVPITLREKAAQRFDRLVTSGIRKTLISRHFRSRPAARHLSAPATGAQSTICSDLAA
jgi:hypothetical protein